MPDGGEAVEGVLKDGEAVVEVPGAGGPLEEVLEDDEDV